MTVAVVAVLALVAMCFLFAYAMVRLAPSVEPNQDEPEPEPPPIKLLAKVKTESRGAGRYWLSLGNRQYVGDLTEVRELPSGEKLERGEAARIDARMQEFAVSQGYDWFGFRYRSGEWEFEW